MKEKITIKCINSYMLTGYNITKHQNVYFEDISLIYFKYFSASDCGERILHLFRVLQANRKTVELIFTFNLATNVFSVFEFKIISLPNLSITTPIRLLSNSISSVFSSPANIPNVLLNSFLYRICWSPPSAAVIVMLSILSTR